MKPGDVVVCVDDRGTAINMDLPPELVEGRNYTVAWAGQYTDPFYDGTYHGIRLAEVVRGVDPVSGEHDKPFKSTRFKPVTTGKNQSTTKLKENV
jgi:hypothetical protein